MTRILIILVVVDDQEPGARVLPPGEAIGPVVDVFRVHSELLDLRFCWAHLRAAR